MTTGGYQLWTRALFCL